jgi:hypothetical protein
MLKLMLQELWEHEWAKVRLDCHLPLTYSN